MDHSVTLFMVLLGCKPKGRNTEQHDIFFGFGKDLKNLKGQINAFWPDAGEKIHIDAWREVNTVGSYQIKVRLKDHKQPPSQGHRLFFINLGGYKREEFEEYHYKMLVVAEDKGQAVKEA
ncbi:MAG TPA: DUF1543 domain-containing protein, partial [Flavisolibacter sp.]|nr:DUF1543 domain-containing protein [Flavisolibacter sp.]